MNLPPFLRVWKQLIAASILLPVGATLMATPEPPPVLCIDDSGCVETSDRYSLQEAIVGVPFPIELPMAPTITSEATVTPETIGANKVNGRRLILTAGDYGSQSFSTQDQEIIITSGVVIRNLSTGSNARRLLFRADPIRTGQIGGFDVSYSQDIVLDGINVEHIPGGTRNNFVSGERFALINSYVRQWSYVIFGSGPIHSVIANNVLWGFGEMGDEAQSATRFHDAQQLVYVDNRVLKTGSTHHVFRTHGSDPGGPIANNNYIARNQFEFNPMMVRADGGAGETGMGSVWFEDNDWYFSLGWAQPMQMEAYDAPEFLSLRNNRLYSASGSWPPQYRANWIYENNQRFPYRDPPAWNFR
jgi:hypothetical protein